MKHSPSLLLSAACLALCAGGAAADAPFTGTINSYVPGSGNDPQVRLAQYQAANGEYFTASAELASMQTEDPHQQYAQAFFRDFADDTLSFGDPQRAEVIFREQTATTKDPLRLAKERLRLADFYYQRGYFPEATAELTAIRQDLPKELLVSWQDLQSRVLLAQGRYGEAADILTQGNNAGDQTPYMRYNLAVALINDGRVDQGITILDRVGRLTPTTENELVLRDKANLTLGYEFLRNKQGGTAIPIFGRVRDPGPYTTRALLGAGWACLAPRGSQQKRTETGDEKPDQTAFTSFATIGVLLRPGYIDDSIYKRAQLAPFHLKGRSADEEAQLKQALAYWVKLTEPGRDPMDPAVQEGMLAIPYVLDRLGAHIQAQQKYEQVIPYLEQTRKRLDEAMSDVRTGIMLNRMVLDNAMVENGWTWRLHALPNKPETFYLQSMIAENKFQEGLKDYRDVRLLEARLAGVRGRLAELQRTYQQSSTTQDAPAAAGEPAAAPAPGPAGTGLHDTPDNGPALQMSQKLQSFNQGAEGTPPQADTGAPLNLQMASAPAADQFVGPFERMQALTGRIDALLPQLQQAEQQQRAFLETMALDELQRQKDQNEKYLAESRFALARLYDSQPKSDAK
jgi:predicted negative regulator of RcsB-dependent stress response